MSSFHKTSSHSTINGTKLKNNIPHISSGIPSLDFIIGGGLPTGSIFAVEEDVLGSYSRVLTKYFLAEGVVCKHGLFIASADEDPKTIVKELPQPCTATEHKLPQDVNSEMKIAWRYEGLGQVESSFGSNTNFGHHFDLSKHMDAETVKQSDVTYCSLKLNENKENNGFRNSLYYDLLFEIKKAISKEEYQSNGKNKNILRISIQSLGSPPWMALDCDDETNTNYGQDLIKFLYCLRVLIRNTNAVVFITIPEHLFEDSHVMQRLLYSVGSAVSIESFSGSSKESNPVYSEYHGLFHVRRLGAVALGASAPPRDLAFKLKRKKFVIEKLHLPPELQESSEREQDDITATPTCGGFKKKDIEF